MKKIALIAALATFISGCSFNVKTPHVANYSNLDKITATTTQNDVAILLGAPQSVGTYHHRGAAKALQFYYGFAGTFTLSSARMDSGTAFISYADSKPSDVIYFRSKATGPEITFSKPLSIKEIASSVALGLSRVDDVFQALGHPEYEGSRIDFTANVKHRLAFWDASEVQQAGAIKEKWLLIGYDDQRVVQDIIWASSLPEDIQEFGAIEEHKLKQLSRSTVAGFLPVLEPTGMSAGTKIDPVQVDALMKSPPPTVQKVIEVLGRPSALGIKSFKGDTPMLLSNWSFSSLEMKGEEHNFIPPGASQEEMREIMDASYMVMKIDQSRLLVGHSPDGKITEIMWFRPR